MKTLKDVYDHHRQAAEAALRRAEGWTQTATTTANAVRADAFRRCAHESLAEAGVHAQAALAIEPFLPSAPATPAVAIAA
ncbi:MAG: hypothetical protein DI570_29220 [Phenylobacterium zucineum]|nr:MAG: hypothetical protein DI570_29220 [Phenylobacterium zucineum]